jgi:hypothetical protein
MQQTQTQPNEVVTAVGGNLDNASLYVELASITGKIEEGKRLLRLVAKTSKDGSKALDKSLALIVPASLAVVNDALKYSAIKDYLQECIVKVQQDIAKSWAVAGHAQCPHVNLQLPAIDSFLSEQDESLGRLKLADLQGVAQAHMEVLLAAYSAVSGKEVTAANASTLTKSLTDLLCVCAEPNGKILFPTVKQETLIGIFAENLPAEQPLKARIAAKVQASKGNREKMSDALDI